MSNTFVPMISDIWCTYKITKYCERMYSCNVYTIYTLIIANKWYISKITNIGINQIKYLVFHLICFCLFIKTL